MTTTATLLTRLYSRLGITTASTAEASLAGEALNAALAKVAAEGAPSLRQVYSGYTLADASVTITHTAASSTATLSSVAGVYPGCTLVNATTGAKYLIRTVTTSGATIDLGVPVLTSMTGNTVTVRRNALPLPHAGTVWKVYQVDGPELTWDPLVAVRKQFDVGVPSHYTQGYAETLGASYISLYPSPSSVTQYLVVQGPAFTKDGDIYASEAVLQAVLARAYEYRLLMSSQAGAAQLAAEMSQSVEILRTKASSGPGVMTR